MLQDVEEDTSLFKPFRLVQCPVEHDINTVRVSGLIPTRGTHAEIVL